VRNIKTLIEETYEKREKVKIDKEKRVHELKEKIEDISQKMIARAKSLSANVMKTRQDPEILQLWNQLCQYHMQAISLCMTFQNKPKVCSAVLKPLGCVEIMHLSDEETCCNRYLKRVDVHHPYW
jgi:hypothetical protein